MSRLLMVPGLRGSEPEHWQSWWERLDPSIRRVHQTDWHHGELSRWSSAVIAAIDQSTEPVWLVAHSFGCLASVEAARQRPERVAGLFLVAPAAPARFAIADEILDFSLPMPSMVIGSTTDPYLNISRAWDWSKRWGSQFVNLGPVGHINVASGHGPWPRGKWLFDHFRSQFETVTPFAWRLSA